MSLVDVTKKFKDQGINNKILIQNVEWDLDQSFFGAPMVPRVLKLLSKYVDQRLTEYSSIYGANPATNMPRALLNYGDEPTLNLNNVCMGHSRERGLSINTRTDLAVVEPIQQGVDSTNNGIFIDDLQVLNAAEAIQTRIQNDSAITISDGTGDDLHIADLNVQREQLIISYPNISDVRVHPGVRTREELEARVRNGEGVIIDDPELFDPSETWMIRQLPKQVASEGEERDSHISSEITIPPESSLHQTEPRVETVPAEDQEMGFSEVVQRGLAAGIQVDGINPANFSFNSTEEFDPTDPSRRDVGNYFPPPPHVAGGYDPDRPGDNHVYASGALPNARLRLRDSFMRNKHLTLRVPQYELMGPNAVKDIAYVTSYTVEHQTRKIKARIVTAPPNITLADDTWFELCTSDKDNVHTLKNLIKKTIKANLCIYKPSRVDYDSTIDQAEKTALETLRDMITEQEFRHYLRYGFLTVKGSSGRIYQIPRKRSHTKVWEHGKLIEEVCVRIKDKNIPPSDNIIAFKTMIETNESQFKALGNVYKSG